MSNIVFVVANYEPYCDPTTRIAKKIIEYFQNNNNIWVISFAQPESKIEYEENGIQYISLRNKLELYEKECQTPSFLLKIFWKIRHVFMFPHGYSWYVNAVYKKLKVIDKKNKIDMVFAVSAPYAALLAAYKWKKSNKYCKVINYIVDPYRFTSVIEKILHYRKYKNLEKAIYSKADYNLYFDAVKNQMDPRLNEKSDILFTQIYPNVSQCEKKERETGRINVTYTGGFYKEFRNPSYMLKVIDKIQTYDIKLHIYSNGSCAEIIEPYYKENPEHFIKEPWIDNEILKSQIANMDFLINISNGIKGFQPSKLFEYIATGIPIISFFTNGLREDLLDKYPYAIQIDCDFEDVETAAFKVEKFIKDTLGKRVSEIEIIKRYPENTIYHFEETLGKMMKYLKTNRYEENI